MKNAVSPWLAPALSDGTYDYDYDGEGNLTLKTDISSGEYTEFTYDHRNRMTSATTYSSGDVLLQEVEFTYDVFDRRIAKTVDADGAGTGSAETIYTVYDGQHAWADFDESEAVVARYFFGNSVDEIVARWWPTEGTAWYLTDHLGTVRDIVDADGDLTNTITYDSFGNILSQTDANEGDRFTYTGREYDEELDLYYYRARYYDPRLGRFVSEDPIGFAAGDANIYRYVGNSPTVFVDPFGLETYVQNRQLNPNSLDVRAPVEHIVSHTFVYTTDGNGNVKRTMSWGNEYRDGNPSNWYENRLEDLSAAREAEGQRSAWEDASWWEKAFLPDNFEDPVGDDSFDEYVYDAFEELRELGENSPSAHDWQLFNNCKHEADCLIERARSKQASDQSSQATGNSGQGIKSKS